MDWVMSGGVLEALSSWVPSLEPPAPATSPAPALDTPDVKYLAQFEDKALQLLRRYEGPEAPPFLPWWTNGEEENVGALWALRDSEWEADDPTVSDLTPGDPDYTTEYHWNSYNGQEDRFSGYNSSAFFTSSNFSQRDILTSDDPKLNDVMASRNPRHRRSLWPANTIQTREGYGQKPQV